MRQRRVAHVLKYEPCDKSYLLGHIRRRGKGYVIGSKTHLTKQLYFLMLYCYTTVPG